MRSAIGLLMIVSGVAFGVWAGVWWAFIGGIVQVIEQVRAPELSAAMVAYGVAKILFAGAIGVFSGMALVLPGIAMIGSK